MINFNDFIKENIKKRNRHYLQVPDHLYRILIIGGSTSENTSVLLNLVSH